MTEEALIKLLKITVFIIKHHWAYINNYEDFVKFIGNNLQEKVLFEYLKLTQSHKNARYLSKCTVAQFVEVISNWMRKKT